MPPPPGVNFLLRAFLRLSLPVAGIYGLSHIVEKLRLGVRVPSAVVIGACFAINPLLLALKGAWTAYIQRREARGMGAVPIPVVRGEKRWPGNFDLLLFLMDAFEHGYPAEPFWEIAERVGHFFNLKILGQDQLFTTEPEHIKQVLATEFNNFEKGEEFNKSTISVLGTGVFNSDGDLWKFHRSMTRPFFSRDRISHFQLFERHADSAIGLMKQRICEGYALDVQDVFSRFTLDSASEFLFGACVDSLKSTELGLAYPHDAPAQLHSTKANSVSSADKAPARFSEAFSKAQKAISLRLRLGDNWPLWELFEDKTRGEMETVDAYLQPILQQALAKKGDIKKTAEDKDEIAEDETLLDHLATLTDDRKLLKDELLNIMIAGRDTTAATLTFAVYCLSENPGVLSRLREEILGKVGSARPPSYDDIKEMKFLRAVINETLRLYPVVPFNVRTSIKCTTFPSPIPGGRPFYVPARTNVAYSVFMTHRRKDLWGPDALEFDPDRFIDERLHKYLTPNPFIFVPFNAGPRICLGQQFAYNEVSFMLVRLLQSFSTIQLDTKSQPPDTRPPESWKNVGGRQAIERIFPKSHLSLYSHGGLWVRMEEASNEVETA
ncbi:cytochrome P450 [Schizopora paradoxa]|uniref:Cytochrome P450 n=1 Tax=Schizopora paradoxa TaxID=27342 RepID=A0A0H2S3Q8_9AGAM|nr:cytochrome P450 [Schizopora paradoxa]